MMERTARVIGWGVVLLVGLYGVAEVTQVAPAPGETLEQVSEVTAEQTAADTKDKPFKKKSKKGAKKGTEPEREAAITAERIEFDNKEGIILFDGNVLVDDEQFVMRSERLLVFLEGTNDVQQIMAVGAVLITNENRTASCNKAVFTRKDGQIVMTGDAKLYRTGDEGGEVTGNRIVFWLDDERMEVSPGRVVLPPGTFKKTEKSFLP